MRTRRGGRRGLGLHAAATAALLLGLLGQTLATAAPWYETAAIRALHARARAEGKVVVWATSQREVEWVQAPFARRFPGIRVEWYADINSPTKAIAEARAGRTTVDVFLYSLGGMLPLAERQLLAPVDWSTAGMDLSETAFAGHARFTHNGVFVFAYNRERVKASELPRTWDDVLDHRWKGRLVASEFLLPRMIAVLGLAWGEQKAAAYARALVGPNDVLITRAPRETFLQSGERVGGIGETVNSARLWAAQGLSIGHVIPTPVASVQFAVAVSAKAPHADAARLFAFWISSAEGKRARGEYRFDIDVRPGSEDPTYRRLVAENAPFIYETPGNMAEREALYRKLIPIVARQR
jgi:ABC-type Fe3+ transport system substrate-binding protein